MEAILKGILASSHPDKMKKQLISVIAKKGSQLHQVASIKSVLQTTTEWVLESNSNVAVEGGLEVYITWGKFNLSTLEDFFNKDFLLELMQKKVANEGNAIVLIHETFNLLQMSLKFQNYAQLFQAKCIGYTREHPDIHCLTNLAKFLKEFQSCIPSGDFTSAFCVSLIRSLSLCPVPVKELEVLDYVKKVEIVCGFVNIIWNRSDSGVIQDSLKAIFEIISQVEDSDLEPSICLGGFVQYIPLAMIDMVVKNTIGNKDIQNPQMIAVLQRIIDWIHWPTAKSIDKWIVAFLRALAVEKRYTVLIKVTESKVDKVFESVAIPLVREGAIHVACQMLLSFQHSPEPFHKVISCVPKVIDSLKKDGDLAEKQLTTVVEVLHCCMYLHAGYPDLYDPVLDIIKGLSSPSEETIKKRLDESKWTAQKGGVASFTTKVKQKSSTGKTGLFNLGNTCYMNSILQAIYMCDGFRRAVISHPVSADENVMLKLQYTFAFLTLTQRPAYAPVNFLSVSRPPWFIAGHQQDCSEFLKYLFDQLHEQEFAAHKKSKPLVKNDENMGSSGENMQEESVNCNSNTNVSCSDSYYSLIRKMFGGCSKTTYKCGNCLRESVRSEHFIDIPLAFPEKTDNSVIIDSSINSAEENHEKKTENTPNASNSSERLHLNDLLQYYLKPEPLVGDNQYHCDSCGGLQDGERNIQITVAPEYLILTLLRFSYNIKTHSRSKICDDVKYPKTLVLPVGQKSSSSGDKRRSLRSAVTRHINNCGVNTQTSKGEVYGLCGVVVHSGTSSECGHYYTYARHSIFNDPDATCDGIEQCKNEDDLDFLQEKWYLFNDCRVSYGSYKSFCDVTQRFSKDTAYKLFYKRIHQENANSEDYDLNKSLQTADIDPPLRSELRIAVSKDNAMFLQEQENSELRKNRKRPGPPSSLWNNRHNYDDKEDPPGSCGGGSGFGGLDGPKFVF